MTAGQRLIAQPAFGGRTAGVVLAATFGVGLVTGLVAPLVHLPAAPAAQAQAADTAAVTAWLAYRRDERTVPVVASQIGDPSWQTYRRGERSSLGGSAPASTPDAVGAAATRPAATKRAAMASPGR